LEYVATHGREFDVIHASPPCQRFSEATPMSHRNGHPDLIAPTRTALERTGKPYIIENVENARRELVNPVKICGSMLGLPVWRHRYFEIFPFWFLSPGTCFHLHRPITVHSGSHTRATWEPVLCTGGADSKDAKRNLIRPRESVEVVRWAMGIDWMLQRELTESIPPAYTQWLGQRILEAL
jgi:DNA (cytosine-5)-methyltransferase 1